MKAGFYAGPGRFEVVEAPEPRISGPEDVLLEVEVAGMCGTDLHIVSVPQLHPAADRIVLGHELVGRVIEKGPAVHGLSAGSIVVVGPNVWCGQCAPCRRGQRTMCQHSQAIGITRDGGFARYVAVPARALYPVPEGLTAEEAVFAEPLSCVLNGFHRIGPSYGDQVAVLGAGPIGLYFTRLFRHFGADRILVTEPIEARRAEAIRSGATHVLDPGADPVVEAIREHTGGGADLVVDTTGFLLGDAVRMARRRGTILVFGMDATCEAAVRPFDLVREEKSIVGCFVNNDQIPRCLELIPRLRLQELISHRLPLSRIGDGIEALRAREAIKVMVYPAGA